MNKVSCLIYSLFNAVVLFGIIILRNNVSSRKEYYLPPFPHISYYIVFLLQFQH